MHADMHVPCTLTALLAYYSNVASSRHNSPHLLLPSTPPTLTSHPTHSHRILTHSHLILTLTSHPHTHISSSHSHHTLTLTSHPHILTSHPHTLTSHPHTCITSSHTRITPSHTHTLTHSHHILTHSHLTPTHNHRWSNRRYCLSPGRTSGPTSLISSPTLRTGSERQRRPWPRECTTTLQQRWRATLVL